MQSMRSGADSLRIWIDITNSPHVLFFQPIVRDLIASGHEVELTARDYAQTVPLLAQREIPYTLIGRHQGKSMVRKGLGLVSRSFRLMSWARGRKFDVAFSHNSNDMAVAARLLGIPQLIVHDYEYANLSYAVNARFANRILVPEAIPADAIVAHGAKPAKVGHFPGLKEHVYLDRTAVWENLRAGFGVPDGGVLAVVRPPATMSAYHRFENDLFGTVVAKVAETPDTVVVLLPRTPEQRAELSASGLPGNVTIPDGVLDATSLLRSADLVLSAGGTMNREAAVFGVPAYTVFAGAMGAVDKYLIAEGRLVHVHDPADVVVAPRAESDGWWVENRSVILGELIALGEARSRRK